MGCSELEVKTDGVENDRGLVGVEVWLSLLADLDTVLGVVEVDEAGVTLPPMLEAHISHRYIPTLEPERCSLDT